MIGYVDHLGKRILVHIDIIDGEIVISYPKDISTENWYHAVRIAHFE